jgi:light-regulated signal transduction histidine kinase (bacteriophytochrome)
MRAPTGEIFGYSKVVQDVTARKQAEEALSRQAEQLQEANRLKDEFLAVLSHELRTPLNAIIGWTHMLRREQLEPAVARQALDAIARNGEAQLRLVNDILDVSRFMAGKLRLNLSAVDLRDAVREAADTGAVAAQAKGVELRLEVEDEPLPVNGDPERLRQVASNLVSNAVKFTPSGGHVTVTVARRQDTACVSVSDDGIGIAPAFWRLGQGTMSKALRAADEALPAGALRGIPAGPGRATGPARIVRGLEEFSRVREGDVLIAPATAPAWTPLFAKIAAPSLSRPRIVRSEAGET